MTTHPRCAWGGIAGPAAFVSAWVVGGAAKPGYSPVDDAISRLAAIGASTRPLMTAGFVGFGLAVPVYAIALRSYLPGPAWKAAAATGVAGLFVAALPLGRSATIDSVHAAAAAAGYLTLAATPMLAARPLATSGRRRAAAASVAIGVASGLCLGATVLGPAHGLFQRVGLTLGDAWLVTTAIAMLTAGRLEAPAPGGVAATPRP